MLPSINTVMMSVTTDMILRDQTSQGKEIPSAKARDIYPIRDATER